MSVHVMAQVWRLRLGTNRKMVLLKLADHANDDGENAYPSIASLAEHCGVAERSVRRFLRGFEEAGVLERQGDGKGGRGKTTCYRLRIGIAQRAYGTIARGGKGGAGESAGDDGAGESGAGEGGAGEGGAAVENAVNPDRVTAFSDAGGAEKGDRLSAFGDRKGDSSDRKGDSGDHKPGQAVSAEPSRTIQNRPFAPASAREAPGAAAVAGGAAAPVAGEVDPDTLSPGDEARQLVSQHWRDNAGLLRRELAKRTSWDKAHDLVDQAVVLTDDGEAMTLAVPAISGWVTGWRQIYARMVGEILGRTVSVEPKGWATTKWQEASRARLREQLAADRAGSARGGR